MNELKFKKHSDFPEKHRKKKKKKHRKKKHTKSSSDETDSDSYEMEWVEAPAPAAVKVEDKREKWMNEEEFVSTLSKEDIRSGSSRNRRKEAQNKKRAQEEEIRKEQELNPYWKNNGKGVPEEETHTSNLRLPSTSVGDGGYSYLKKAYLRIKEQAQKEGRSMEEVAVERWGSLDKLTSMIEEAECRMKIHSSSKYSDSSKIRYEKGHRGARNDRFQVPYDDAKSEQSPSPKRSMKYQRPKYDTKTRQKFNYFSSSRASKADKITSEDTKRSIDSSHDPLTRIKEELFHEKKVTSSDRPAWKKPAYGNEVNKERKTCQKSSFEEERNSSSRQPYAPAWKKPKHMNEADQEMLEESHESEELERLENSSQSDNPPVTYSGDDLNHLAAKYLRAELNGDMATATKFKKQLDEARLLVNDNKSIHTKRQEEVILTKLDSRGLARPVQLSHQDYPKYKDKRSNKYFDDTSKYSLKQMFEREKLTTTEDNLEMFLDAAAECKEDSEVDNEQGFISKKVSQKMAHSRQEEKDIGKAIRQHQRLNAALEKCEYCLDQPKMKRYLLVDIRPQIYLCLPSYQSLVENHCLIVPKQHVSSFLALDEDEWREVEDMKYNLRKWFKTQKKSVIFIETSMNFRYCPHAVLECIPIPEETGDMAPFYFKKAIQESEVEWAHNQKLVDLTKKGLCRSIPKGLPYFYVEFDKAVHAGYAHVIEDERQFPRNFGKEVIGGMLDIDYNYLYKNKKDNPLKKSEEVAQFEELWKKFMSENP